MLLGANGAGKTTLLKVLVGLLPAWNGHIRLDGQDITRLRTDRRVRRGMAYMSELGVFPGLSIEENLRIGGRASDRATLRRRLDELFQIFPDLAGRRRALAGSSLRRTTQNARHRQSTRRQSPPARHGRTVGRTLPAIRRNRSSPCSAASGTEGLAMLIAEQNVAFLDLADRVFTLEGGRTRFEGTVEQLNADDALHRAYFGLA